MITKKTALRRLALPLALCFLLLPVSAKADQVTDWNAIGAIGALNAGKSPAALSIDLAYMHAAIYDAVNAIDGRCSVYAVKPSNVPPDASKEAAAVAAAYNVLKTLLPTQQAFLDSQYATSLAAIPGGDAKTYGIAVGEEVAALFLASRAGTWSATGSLHMPHSYHSATLLPDGEVLVVGGGGDPKLGSAELYDPDTGAWSVTGRANTLRESHTATLLPDGQILVAGGGRQFWNLDTNELYNPATARWNFTSDLIRHTNHTATLLPNGKVLVAGGDTYDGVFNTVNGAEIYDPATGNWNSTASLNAPRSSHTATLLQNGKVLVVGGKFGSDYLRSAELYDPEVLDPVPRIIMASVSGKKLFITGENFHAGAVILLNGEEQKCKNDDQNPQTTLIGKKAGKKIKSGDRLQVRNPDGTLSEAFTFTSK